MKTKFSQFLKKVGLTLKSQINSLTLYEKLTVLISFVGALSLVFIFIQTMQATANMEIAKENNDLSKQNMELSRKAMELSIRSMELSIRSMKSSMYEIVNAQTLEMDKIFLERPHLRPYFYDGEDPSKIRGQKTRHEVMIVAEYQLDFFDLVMTQLDYIPDDLDSAEDKANWEAYFAYSFANSPALCKTIADNPDWYMKRLGNRAKKNCRTPS